MTAGELLFLQRIKHFSKIDDSTFSKDQDNCLKETVKVILSQLSSINSEIGLTENTIRNDNDVSRNQSKQRILCLELQVMYIWCLLFSRESQLTKAISTDMQR